MSLTTIKESFECWYNKHIAKKPVSIVINYSDIQTSLLKAYHVAKVEMSAIFIEDNHAVVLPLLRLQENYNHGVTTEGEAKEMMTQKLLQALYSYRQ